MGVRQLGLNVFDAAIDRLVALYSQGHRLIISFSAGKDSGVILELAIIAAKMTGRLPVEVVMRDEEILFVGSFEYAERVAERPEIEFHWMVARQPIVNVFNRRAPYFWAFDPQLPPEEWVRVPPAIAYDIPEKHIQGMVTPKRFPPAEGKELFTILGLRAAESVNRKLGIHSSGSYLTKANSWGARTARPIYDWQDGDVWKFIAENKVDYNSAYDVMARLGVPKTHMRIAPPTLTAAGIAHLGLAARAWPKWFDRVCKRLEGVRTAAYYGRRAVEPPRHQGESWQETFERECVERAPDWIAERAKKVRDSQLALHARHSTGEFPQNTACPKCGLTCSWKVLVKVMYMGDPFGMKTKLPPLEPEFFREGAGTWGGGKPTW